MAIATSDHGSDNVKEKIEHIIHNEFNGKLTNEKVSDGSVVLAAITSCTNTSNPNVMIGAGLIAKNAIKLGLKVTQQITKVSSCY